MDKIKHTFTINIEMTSINCYHMDNGDRFINVNVERLLKSSIKNVPTKTIIDSEGNEIKVYTINDILDHIKPRTIKELARTGLVAMIDESCAAEKSKEGTEGNQLSEFDKLIKQALDFNPNR